MSEKVKVTEFEKQVLTAVKDINDEIGTQACAGAQPKEVADVLGVSVYRVNGSISVLLKKDLVESYKIKPEKRAFRVVQVTDEGCYVMDWKSDTKG